MGRVLSCCALEKPTESATLVTSGSPRKGTREALKGQGISKESLAKDGVSKDTTTTKDSKGERKDSPRSGTKKRSSISAKVQSPSKGEIGKTDGGDANAAPDKADAKKATSEGEQSKTSKRRASVAGKASSEAETRSPSRRASIAKAPPSEEEKSPDKEKSSKSRRASMAKAADMPSESSEKTPNRRASTLKATSESDASPSHGATSEKEAPASATADKAAPSSPAADKGQTSDSQSPSPNRRASTNEKADSKRRRASQEDAGGASHRDPSQPRVVSAPLAIVDATGNSKPSEDDFVLMRPLPYDPVPWDGENHRQRSFLYKDSIFVVPMLPLHSPREGASKSGSKAKNEDVRQGKGWKVVKSKVVGGAMKAE
mmetsp:Transcript_37683/g.87128  ORF Transcript_37683/g.87128 Transcript_37683/m.87128 type:complete len:373 (-) Transcript_37683:16-1134(-)